MGRCTELILVVDDDPDIRQGLATVLRARGYDVMCARDGVEALSALTDGVRPSLILLDLEMPVMDGEAFRSIQRLDGELRRIPVALVSGSPRASRVAAAMGNVPVLLKPFKAAAAIGLVQDLLRSCDSGAATANAPR